MANITWNEIQNIPGNPVDGFRTFMEGMRGAEAAARGIRENQLKNTDMTLKIMDSISKDQRAAMAGAGGGGGGGSAGRTGGTTKAEPFNRQELGVAAKDHYFSGGTVDDFEFANFDPTDEKQYTFVSNIFKDNEANLERSIGLASNALDVEEAEAIESLGTMLEQGSPEYLEELRRTKQEFGARRESIASTQFNQLQKNYQKSRERAGVNLNKPVVSHDALFSGSAARQLESRATGVTPKQVSQGSTGNPSFAQSRIAERDAEANMQAGVRDKSIAAIEEALGSGDLTEEEAAVQIALANEQYDTIMQDYDKDWGRSVMTGADGSIYGTDYQYNEDGNIRVSGQTLPPNVSNAIQEAAEISGIPVDTQLAMYRAESGYNPSAVSKTGAGGLGQLTGPAIKDVIQNYPEELEAAGIPLSADMDRLDPRKNAIVSALYMKLQHEKYLGGKGSIEDRYIAYNIGVGNSFAANERFANADPDTPINQIGFPVSSEAVQKNIDVYRKPNGQWRTKNEVYSEIRRRMGITAALPEDANSARTIEEKVAAENARTPSELPLAEQVKTPADVHISERYQELASINPMTRPEAFANATYAIADSIVPDPSVVKGESVSNLDVTFYEEALNKAGVPADSKTVARVREAFIKDPELNRLSSTDVSMLISFAEKGMWGSGLDMAGLRTNIKKIKANQENNRKEYRQFVDDSVVLKKVSDQIRTSVKTFDERMTSEQEKLDGYNYELSQTNDPRARGVLVRAKNSVNRKLEKDKTLHEQRLQRLTTEALDRAGKIETMNQHLREVFNKGVSNAALADINKAASGSSVSVPQDLEQRVNSATVTNKEHMALRQVDQFFGNPFDDYVGDRESKPKKEKPAPTSKPLSPAKGGTLHKNPQTLSEFLKSGRSPF